MFIKRLFECVPTEIEKMLLEQQDTLRKLNTIQNEVDKIKNNPAPEIIKNMYDASNTLQKPIFDASKIPVIEKAEKFFDGIDRVANYITHPILIFNVFAGVSYWVCLFVGIGGILFYVAGFKKGLKYTSGSLLGYTLIQTINAGLNLL